MRFDKTSNIVYLNDLTRFFVFQNCVKFFFDFIIILSNSNQNYYSINFSSNNFETEVFENYNNIFATSNLLYYCNIMLSLISLSKKNLKRI